jgi:TonB family protein
MNRFEARVCLRVLGIHAGVVFFFVIQSFLHGCFHREPKREIVTFVDFGEPRPTPDIQEVKSITPDPQPAPTPEPVIQEQPKPRPVPKPEPKPVPKPEPKPAPKPEPKKSDWTPVAADQIKIGKKVNDTPAQPAISPADIQKQLSGIVDKPSAKAGNPDEIAAYDAHIHSVFYNAWTQPAVAAAQPAEVTISITATGLIKTWRLTRKSGDAEYDASVESAVRKISMLPKKPPAGYPLDNIVITFSIN